MQSLRLNPILNTDSYKLTHWWQYPPDTRHIYSYVESRGGMFEETMLAMLQYIVKSNFAGQVFTLDDVEEARRFAHAHFGGHPKSFNYEGFKSLYAKHGGRLPLRNARQIRARDPLPHRQPGRIGGRLGDDLACD
jgi:nicotinamide phosphoribosyltransferase